MLCCKDSMRWRILARNPAIPADFLSIIEVAHCLAKKDEEKSMTNKEMRQETLEVVQLSEKAPVGIPGPLSWGGGQDGVEMVTFQQEDEFYAYQRGTKNGLYSEGEEQGPFKTRREAEADLRAQYEESLQPPQDIYPSEYL